MTVRFCPVCGRINLADFRFCPYCGEEAEREGGLDAAIERPFRRLEALGVEGRFAELREALDGLESDMEELLAEGRRRAEEPSESGSPIVEKPH